MVEVSDISIPTSPGHLPDLIALFLQSISAAKKQGILLPKPENFESEFVERMRPWASSPEYGVKVDTATEAKLYNVASFLADALFGDQPCPDPKTRLSQEETDHLLNFVGLSFMIGGIALKVSELPPSPGYEPMLREHGFNSISARGLAHLLVKSGKRQEKEEQLRLSVVKAIRGLAQPQAESQLLERARIVLQAADESTIVDTICCEVGLREFDLSAPLQALVSGKPVDRQRLTEIIEKLTPALSVRRGPKRSAASAAHEFALASGLPAQLGCSAYTLNDVMGDFTDPLTQATRREFSDPHFDPRPAHRRVKKRQLAKIG
jgi:hypothetical protein